MCPVKTRWCIHWLTWSRVNTHFVFCNFLWRDPPFDSAALTTPWNRPISTHALMSLPLRIDWRIIIISICTSHKPNSWSTFSSFIHLYLFIYSSIVCLWKRFSQFKHYFVNLRYDWLWLAVQEQVVKPVHSPVQDLFYEAGSTTSRIWFSYPAELILTIQSGCGHMRLVIRFIYLLLKLFDQEQETIWIWSHLFPSHVIYMNSLCVSDSFSLSGETL